MTASVRSTRAERLAQIRALQAEGLTHRQIGERIGLTESGVRNILNDPDGSKQKARRVRYQGVCEICGSPTSGCDGKAKAPRHCLDCAGTASIVWTADIVLERIREWAAIHGQPPAAYEWNPGLARQRGCLKEADAFEADDRWPFYSTVREKFGSWANGIEAAGFPRPRPGYYRDETRRSGPRLGTRRFDWEEAARLRADGWRLADIAARYGVHEQSVYRALRSQRAAA